MYCKNESKEKTYNVHVNIEYGIDEYEDGWNTLLFYSFDTQTQKKYYPTTLLEAVSTVLDFSMHNKKVIENISKSIEYDPENDCFVLMVNVQKNQVPYTGQYIYRAQGSTPAVNSYYILAHFYFTKSISASNEILNDMKMGA